MEKLLRSRAAKLTFVVTDQDGVAQDATGAVAVVVNRGDGMQLAAGNATKPASTTGIYEFALTPAQCSSLDVLESVWSYTRSGSAEQGSTRHEVVGGFYFSLAEARAFDNGAMQSTTTYPDATIVAGRSLVEDEIERACGVAFVPRARRASLAGADDQRLMLPDRRPRTLLAATVDGTAIGQPDLSAVELDESGTAYRQTAWPKGGAQRSNVVVHYEHGFDAPPERIKRAALVLLRHRLVASNIEDRAISYTDELGTRSLAVAGRGGQSFGIPDVDAAVADYDERVPGIA